jgi:alkylation response protein AidB-like acyl-CoA dehydrogenase
MNSTQMVAERGPSGSTKVGTRPAPLDPVAGVEAMTALIRAECENTDTTRRLPAAVTRALQDAGVFHLLAPREIGGAEIDPVTFLKVVEAAAFADGSVGWCVMIGGCYATFGGMLPAEGARAIYGDPGTISAGAFRPHGVAHEVEGGYRVTGRWPLASGSSHANWYVAGCMVHRNGEPAAGPGGGPLVREVFFPSSVVEIIDTWNSTGLRGTASHDYAVADVFVPSARTAWFQDQPTVDRALYRMPPIAMFATFIGAVPLGIARHAIEEFIVLADAKTLELSTGALADRAVAHAKLGRAHALVAGGRAYLIDALGQLWRQVEAGHPPTIADRGALWLAATHAAQGALEAIGMLYTTAGASSIYATSALDRCLRDARTAIQHVCTQESNFELAGRRLLGRPALPSVWGIDYRGEEAATAASLPVAARA